MNNYERLLEHAYNENIVVIEMPLESDAKGLCVGDTIAIDTNKLDSIAEKRCVLCEEIWHNKVTVGDITDQSKIENRKQERYTRICAINELAPLDKIVQGLLHDCDNIYDLAEYLEVTVQFLTEAFAYYKQKYGDKYYGKYYTLSFNPVYIAGSLIERGEET